MRFMRLSLIGVIVSLISCGGGSSSMVQEEGQTTEAPAPITTAPNSTAVETGTLTVADAGTVYLEIVNPVNCAVHKATDLESANSLGDGTTDPSVLSELKSAYAAIGAARQVAFRSLMEQRWPDAIASDVETLARDWAKVAIAEESLSSAVDVGQWNVYMTAFLELRSKTTANPGFIRATLGVGPASETDRC